MRRTPPHFAVLVLLALLATACSGSGLGTERWRGLTITPPLGWVVDENTDAVLFMANATIEDAGVRGNRDLAVQFSWEPETVADDWRRLVAEESGTLEVDESVMIDGFAATRLVWSWTTNGVPTREMAVLIPGHAVVILMQPVIMLGEDDGPERFDQARGLFDRILDQLELRDPPECLAGGEGPPHCRG